MTMEELEAECSVSIPHSYLSTVVTTGNEEKKSVMECQFLIVTFPHEKRSIIGSAVRARVNSS